MQERFLKKIFRNVYAIIYQCDFWCGYLLPGTCKLKRSPDVLYANAFLVMRTLFLYKENESYHFPTLNEDHAAVKEYDDILS